MLVLYASQHVYRSLRRFHIRRALSIQKFGRRPKSPCPCPIRVALPAVVAYIVEISNVKFIQFRIYHHFQLFIYLIFGLSLYIIIYNIFTE